MANESSTETETSEKSDKEFSAGDAVHFYVGSDCYGGDVERVTKARVYVKRRSGGDVLVFTVRATGLYMRMGWEHCTLRHGYVERMDPSF